MALNLRSFLAELKRRRVTSVGLAYVIVAVSVVEGVEILGGPLGVPEEVFGFLATIAIVGFPIAIVLAWIYQVKREKPLDPSGLHPASLDGVPHDERTSIVVLPFDNLSPDPGDAYFSNGLTEEIITDLSFIRSLRVISRSSAMALKGTNKDVRTIGRELGVQYVLEGSVRKAREDLRITAQLIDGRTDSHIWAEKYDGKLDDVFGMQEQVSRAIVKVLKLKLNSEEETHLSENPIDDPRAHDLYLRAVQEYRVCSEDSLKKALVHLQEAQDLVGENALLYAGMAIVHFYYVDAMARPFNETLDKAEKLVWKSLRLDPDSSLAHHLMGRIERYRGSAVSAVRHFEQAFRISPNDTENLLFLSWMGSLFLGQTAAAKPVAKRLVEVDPLFPMRVVPLAWIDWMEGRYDAALRHLDTSLEECPEFRWPLLFKTQLLARNGEVEASLGVIEFTLKEDSTDTVASLCSLFRAAIKGDDAAFSEQLTDPLRELLWNDPECPFWMAGWTALLGRHQESVEWLGRAVERGWINYPLMAQDDPFLEKVRGEPGFLGLMEGVKGEWEGFDS